MEKITVTNGSKDKEFLLGHSVLSLCENRKEEVDDNLYWFVEDLKNYTLKDHEKTYVAYIDGIFCGQSNDGKSLYKKGSRLYGKTNFSVFKVPQDSKISRIFIVGPYSADNVIEVLDNIRIGMRKGTELFEKGFSPFVSWFDYQFQLMLKEGEKLNVNDYYRWSNSWLDVSDAVYVLKNSNRSFGARKEIKRVKNELFLPIFNEEKQDLERLLLQPQSF